MIKQLRVYIFFSFISFLAGNALAQTKSAAAKGDKKTTTINFDDELVEGEVKKPELLYLLQKKQFNFKRLIKLRENFIPEMNRTAEDIERAGGDN
jgi:hypothetical protein